MGKILQIFWNKFFEICENFLENCTAVYKAGFSKVGHLYNLITKDVTKYTVVIRLYKCPTVLKPALYTVVKLPPDIRIISSIHIFKSRVKQFLWENTQGNIEAF